MPALPPEELFELDQDHTEQQQLTFGHSIEWVRELTDEFTIETVRQEWPASLKLQKEFAGLAMYFPERSNGYGFEVLCADALAKPSAARLKAIWNNRWANRATPVLLIVSYPVNSEVRAAICGPTTKGKIPPALLNLDMGTAKKVAVAAMSEPNHHAAARALERMLSQLESRFWKKNFPLGLYSNGLMSRHELVSVTPRRSDWSIACELSQPLLQQQGRGLVRTLGFEIRSITNLAQALVFEDEVQAVAVFCMDDESFDAPSSRLNGLSPVMRAFAEADRLTTGKAAWVVVTSGHSIRLYSAQSETGLGCLGSEKKFVELNLVALDESKAGYLHLLSSPTALSEDGMASEILKASEYSRLKGLRIQISVSGRCLEPSLLRRPQCAYGSYCHVPHHICCSKCHEEARCMARHRELLTL